MRKLCCATLGYAGALVLGHYLLPQNIWLHCALAAAVLVLPCLLLKGKWRTRLGLLFGFAALGFLWNWGHFQLFVAPADALCGREEQVEAVVLDYPVSFEAYERLTVRLHQEGLPAAKIYVYDYAHDLADARPGDLVDMELRFFSAMTSRGEDVDNYRSSGIYVRASVIGETVVTGRWDGSFLLLPRELAHLVRRQITESFPADVAPFLTALLTGDKQDIYTQTEVYTALKLVGLTHVIAVSGMHVAFLVGAVRLFTGRRRATAFLCLPLIVLFMALAGMTPSVVRAGVMQALLLIAPTLKRENDALTTLSAAALVILVVNPEAISSISFQLSFAAMAGICLLCSPIYRWLRRAFVGRWWHHVATIFAATFSTQVFTVPLSALYFGYVPLYAPISNALCLWAVSAGFTLGYGVCLLGLLWPLAGHYAGLVVAWLPRYIFAVASRISRWPYAALYTGDNYIAWWLLGVYAVFVLAWLFKGKGKRLRPVIPLCLCVASLALISLRQIQTVPEGSLTVTAVDVGQGQSIVALQENSSVVIDCGGLNILGNAGERTAEFLRSHGHSRVDLLALTHLHADHANGVLYLLELMEVQRIALPRDADDAGYTEPIVARAEELGVEVLYIEEDSRVTLGELELTLIAPLGNADANERGLMILGRFGETDFLVTGDADMSTEALLTNLYELPALELLVVGHHGSRYSTSTELLDETTPAAAFISVGYNTYGHPHETVLQRLEQYGVAVYRTDEEGNITMTVGNDDGEEG